MMTATAQAPIARAMHALALAALFASMAVSLLIPPPSSPREAPALASLSPEAAVARALNQLVATAEGYTLSHPRYTARFAPAGPGLQPAAGGPAWSWRLEQVRLGAQSLPGLNLAPVEPVAGPDQIVRYMRGPIVEQYVPRAGTVEQQFIIPRPLGAGGDLEIRGRVESAGALTASAEGWAWVDSAGRAVTLGDVFVFDAAGASIPALMEVGAAGTRIVVDGAALARAAYPVTVDPQIGAADFQISNQGPANDINYTAFTPTITYNSRDNQYLVAWAGSRGAGEEQIFIQRLAGDGTLLTTAGAAAGTGVQVSVSRGDQIYDALSPELAYNPDRNEYLLVFRMDDPSTGLADNQYEVYGQLLAADGTPVAPADPAQILPNSGALSPFRISFMNASAAGFGDAVEPSVAYSPASREYLVTWWGDKETDERFDIRGRFVAANGALRGPVDLLISSMGPNATNTAYAAYDPAVAYNPVSGEFLVVWSGADQFARALSDLGRLESDYEIHGQRIAAASRALVGENFAISAMQNQLAPSADSRLNEPSFFFDARTPAVAVGGDGRYMVAWQGNAVAVPFTTESGATDYTPVYEVYGQLLDASGAELGPNDIRLSSMGANDTDTRYGLVNGPIYRDDAYSDFVINDGRGGQISFYSIGGSLDVAYDSANDEFMVAWASDNDTGDSRVGATEIFVQRVRASDGAELGTDDHEISSVGESPSARFDAHNPGIAYNGADDEMLTVWTANERDIEFEIYGQRLAFAPPYVVNVNTTNDTGDGTLAQDELTRAQINRIEIALSETVTNPARSSSYLLVEAGPNGSYDSTVCTAAGDDETVSRSMSYNGGTRTVRLTLSGNLPTGRYRLIACPSTTSLVDSDADQLDGNRDGVGGDPFIRDFIVDRTAPVFSQPPNLTVDSPSPAGTTVSFDLSEYVSDSIDASPTISCSPASGSFFNVGVTTVSCTASDDAGNSSAQRSFTVRVIYRTAPVVTVPSDIVVEATGPSGAAVTFSASAADTDGPVPVSCSHSSGATFPLGVTTVTCQATNDLGTTSRQFTITVRDTTDPAVTVPADITAEATGPSGAAVTFSATASDAVDTSLAVSCAPSSGSTFALGSTDVTCSATDDSGNQGSASFTVTVRDTTGPTVTVPANITAEATGPSGANVSFAVSASDSVDSSLSLGCDWSSGELFPLGATLVTCLASDDSGNQGSASFTVTVRDTTRPTVTVPADITVEATGPSGAVVTFSATASDAVDASLTVSCTPSSGSTFALGSANVTCSTTDDSGNQGSASFTVTVRDTTEPTVTVPADVTVEANTTGGATYSFTATGSDTVGPVTVNCTPASGSLFALGTTEVTCQASDGAGNSASDSFNVTVADTSLPVMTLPDSVVVEATGPDGATASFSVTAVDVADSTPTVSCTPASGSLFALGISKVACTATDDSGNVALGGLTVTVRDTTPPALSGLANITTGTTSDAGAPVSFSVTASDLVDGAVAVSCDASSGDTFPIGATTVTCDAADSRGNAAEGSFTVTVLDERIPTMSVPASLTVEANRAGGAVVSYSVTASDSGGPLTAVCAPAAGSFFALGDTDVTCTVTGRNGVQASDSFTVTVRDTTAPALRLPSSSFVEATGPGGARFFFRATASDVADSSVTPSCSSASGSIFALGVTTVTCSVSDDSGNSATGRFQVGVRDTTAPTLARPANQTFQTEDEAGMVVSYALPAASDLVDPAPAVECLPASGQRFPIGTTAVTCTARDAQGNSTSVSFNITVELRGRAPQFRLFLPIVLNNASIPLNNAPCQPNGVSCEPR